MHKKTFRYRIYPTPAQERGLQEALDECRWLYNKLLEERKNAYEQTGKGVSLYTQINRIVELKGERESLKRVHSQVLQNVAVRLGLAFEAFYRRAKSGEKPGYPRFRGTNRYESFTYPQSGFRVEGSRVFLSKIGHIRAVIHRPLEGAVKTTTVRRAPTGKWYVCFSCEVEPEPLPEESTSERVAVLLSVSVAASATLAPES